MQRHSLRGCVSGIDVFGVSFVFLLTDSVRSRGGKKAHSGNLEESLARGNCSPPALSSLVYQDFMMFSSLVTCLCMDTQLISNVKQASRQKSAQYWSNEVNCRITSRRRKHFQASAASSRAIDPLFVPGCRIIGLSEGSKEGPAICQRLLFSPASCGRGSSVVQIAVERFRSLPPPRSAGRVPSRALFFLGIILSGETRDEV